MTTNIIIDGTYKIAEAVSALRFAESRGWKVTALSAGNELTAPAGGGPPGPINWASIVTESWIGGRKDIDLEVCPDASKWPDQVKVRAAAGWNTIFDFPQTLYVESKIRNVGVFRKV